MQLADYRCVRCKEKLDPLKEETKTGLGSSCLAKANIILERELTDNLNKLDKKFVLKLKKFLWPFELKDKISEKLENWTITTSLKDSVNLLTWLCSFNITEKEREIIFNEITKLGLPIYSNFLSKKAATTPGNVWLENGFVKFYGPRIEAGYQAFKKLQEKNPNVVAKQEYINNNEYYLWVWRAPIDQADELFQIIHYYWPFTEYQNIKNQIKNLPEHSIFKQKIEEKPLIFITHISSYTFLIKAIPYTDDFFNEIKSLPRGTRNWNKNQRGWIIRKTELQLVKSLINKHYPTAILKESN